MARTRTLDKPKIGLLLKNRRSSRLSISDTRDTPQVAKHILHDPLDWMIGYLGRTGDMDDNEIDTLAGQFLHASAHQCIFLQ